MAIKKHNPFGAVSSPRTNKPSDILATGSTNSVDSSSASGDMRVDRSADKIKHGVYTA